MKRVPVVPTMIVAILVAVMIALGIWQLERRTEKEAALAQYAANPKLPPMAFPRVPLGDRYLFRRASTFCLKPESWTRLNGRDIAGAVGWRQIAHCSTGAEGPGVTIQLGISSDPDWKPTWTGGAVTGFITQAPDARPAILSLFGKARARTLMLVADTPPPGLRANGRADISAVPNNHLAYAVQWFLFAAIAAGIYALALRQRSIKAKVAPEAPPR